MDSTSELGQSREEHVAGITDSLVQAAEATVQSSLGSQISRRAVLAGIAGLAGTLLGIGAGQETPTVEAPSFARSTPKEEYEAVPKLQIQPSSGNIIPDNRDIQRPIELSVPDSAKKEVEDFVKEEEKRRLVRELKDFSLTLRKMINPGVFIQHYPHLAADMGVEQLVDTKGFSVLEKNENGKKTTTLKLVDRLDPEQAIFLTVSTDVSGLQTRRIELTPPSNIDINLDTAKEISQNLTGIVDMVAPDANNPDVLEGMQKREGLMRIVRVNSQGFISLKEIEEPMAKSSPQQQNI